MTMQDILIYWQVIRKRLWLIVLLVGVTLGVIVLTSYLSKPVYKATVSFQVTAPLPAEVSIFNEFRTSSTSEELARTRINFVAVLQSEFVIGQAMEELGLDVDVDELTKQMVVEPDEESEFIRLRVMATDPELAAAIANVLMDKATQYFGELSAGSITANKEFIEQQLEKVKDELDTAREALIQFRIQNRVGSLDGLLRSQESLITALKQERDQAFVKGDEQATKGYEDVIAQRERELQELILLSSENEVLWDDVVRIKSTYSDLLNTVTEAGLKENEILSARFIRVIPASVPSHSLPRLNVKILLLGGIVSLVLGIIIAFALEYSSRAAVTTGTREQGPAVEVMFGLQTK